ncbi:MAG: hypothetical protein K2Y01_01955 [Rhabdochlamydiaceae bacterium]|nr:hypothetical protein [Rhabdochlamydiaceae bacterium]
MDGQMNMMQGNPEMMGMMKSCCMGMEIFGWVVVIALVTQTVLLAIMLTKINRLSKR